MFNTDTIKELADSSLTAKAIFKGLSGRERTRKILNLTLFKRHLRSSGKTPVSDKDFFITFKKLEGMGVGDLIYGRKGNPDVFVWYYNLRDIGSIGLGYEEIVEANEQAAESVTPGESGVIKVVSQDDKRMLLSIPMDLIKLHAK